MPHAVKLDVFEGPIDLLLHLITRQRVDIYDVSLAHIAHEYLAAVEGAAGLDLESATGFLVVAATLLELKSARLLPGPAQAAEDGGLLEERDLLLARLVECATFRAAGSWIAATLERGALLHPRSGGLEPSLLGLRPDVLQVVEVGDLARAAGAALTPGPEVTLDVSHLAPIRASVRDAIVEVAEELERRSSLSFRELCQRADDRIAVVVRFLALLELFKAGAVELVQAHRFGDIQARWTGESAPGAVLEAAASYAGDAGGGA